MEEKQNSSDPILEAILTNQDDNSKNHERLLEAILVQGDEQNPEHILEAQLVKQDEMVIHLKNLIDKISGVKTIVTNMPDKIELDMGSTNKLLEQLIKREDESVNVSVKLNII